MRKNLILMTDSYKTSHFLQYPPGTEYVTSYIEARAGGVYDHVLFFGLQAFIREYLMEPITINDIVQAATVCREHGVPFNHEGWERIVHLHDGYLPLRIEALPEGSVVPVGTPLVQITNTDPQLPWLTSYFETALLRGVWYPSTIATRSLDARNRLRHFVGQSADGEVESVLDFMLHDFGARGVSSGESATLGGMAHLINFRGTDTIEGMLGAMAYYDSGVCGYSVPASEHSTMTSWGIDHEEDAYRNMLEKFPEGIVSIVADSYDYESAVTRLFCGQLKPEIDARAGKGRVVIRPDSGDPVQTVMFTLRELDAVYGTHVNEKGYKLLPHHIRVMWGDGIDVPAMEGILAVMLKEGFAAENILFGMGGALLQKVNRDTLRFAMKANQIIVNGEVRPVAKQPKTDPSKRSKAGAQAVVWNPMSGLHVMPLADFEAIRHPDDVSLLLPRFLNGNALNEITFDQVRSWSKRTFGILPSAEDKKAA